MRLRKGTVDGYEWRCRNQSKDNRHDVVRSIRDPDQDSLFAFLCLQVIPVQLFVNIMVIRYYPAILSELLKFNFRFSLHTPKTHTGFTFDALPLAPSVARENQKSGCGT
ncbi:hypothetical protein TNCV_4633031 [Trichonephila clavipes]|nr:hypothetical protein TNCV_4633031 [Trichonephila clavipes]